jgi:hypothetical protein
MRYKSGGNIQALRLLIKQIKKVVEIFVGELKRKWDEFLPLFLQFLYIG